MAPPSVDPPPTGPRVPVLAEAARALHTQRDRNQLLAWTVDAARSLSGADLAGIWMLGDERAGWRTSPPHPPAHDGLGRLGDPRLHAGLFPAVRTGAPVHFGDLRGRTGDGDLSAALPATGSLMAVAVPSSDGANHGVLLVADARRERFALHQDELVALGAHLGVALDNAAYRHLLEERRATEQQMVNQLQAAVMPERPEVPLTELGSYYSPADPDVATGGDLHDWIVLPDGDLHFAVVDVMGKGVAATKDALAVTHALRLLVLDGCPLEQLVARADAIVTAQNPELVATLLVGRYRPSTGALRLGGGGHPPALVVKDGVADELMAPGVPIGWPGAGSEAVLEVTLGRTDSVILYTDGLIEGRKDIVSGLATLRRFAEETAPYPAQQQARILVERTLHDARRHDDSLALVLRRRVPPPRAHTTALGPFEHRLSRSMAAVSVSRGLLREWLVHVPVDPEAVHDLLLAATELCANAVQHATWERSGVVLRARTDGGDVMIEVEDDGEGLTWPLLALEPPDPEAESGRGLWLVRTFTDDVVLAVVGGRTVIRAVKRAVVAGL